MCIHLIWIQSGLIPIHFQRWSQSRLIWIAHLRVVFEDQKGHGIHAHVNYRQWAHFSGLHTVLHIFAQLEKQYDGWLKYRSDEGTVVCVEVWSLEVNVHVWIHSTQRSVDQSMCIGFALKLHRAILLLNQFEPGFSVDRPYDSAKSRYFQLYSA